MTETPNYVVLRKDKGVELREYPAYIKAEVTLENMSYRQAILKGFRILAGYIFGNNTSSDEIAMTSPVQVSNTKKIAMTKPVTISGDDAFTVTFIMPSQYSLSTLPTPNDPSVNFTEVKVHSMAAMRFSGFYWESNVRRAERRLKDWLDKEGIRTVGNFIAAGYNPPWVPWFLARNEVMIEIMKPEV